MLHYPCYLIFLCVSGPPQPRVANKGAVQLDLPALPTVPQRPTVLEKLDPPHAVQVRACVCVCVCAAAVCCFCFCCCFCFAPCPASPWGLSCARVNGLTGAATNAINVHAFFNNTHADRRTQRARYNCFVRKETDVYASRAVQFHPHGGQSDFVWLSARTPHRGASYVWCARRNQEKYPPENITTLPLFLV